MITWASLFGYLLAYFENENEVQLNDYRLEAKYRISFLQDITTTLAGAMPSVCLRLYVENVTVDDIVIVLPNITELADQEGDFGQAVIDISALTESELPFDLQTMFVYDAQDIFRFMAECGQRIEQFVVQANDATSFLFGQEQDLTFNWIRCQNTSDDSILNTVGINNQDLRPVRNDTSSGVMKNICESTR